MSITTLTFFAQPRAKSAMSQATALIDALPPVMDHASYLTLVEMTLQKEHLALFHNVLQDTDLTAQIGWDLVHILVPLLPDSQQCLDDVARMGNPREVILKVTEELYDLAKELRKHALPSFEDEISESESSSASVRDDDTDTVDVEKLMTCFIAMVSMLAILHTRISTKYPSRFLSTSLPAILATYKSFPTPHPLLLHAVLTFVSTLNPSAPPSLPPRQNSTSTPLDMRPAIQPDPEADSNSSMIGEREIQIRLLQSFLTYVVDSYLDSLSAVDQVPTVDLVALAWCDIYYRSVHPTKLSGPIRASQNAKYTAALEERHATMKLFQASAASINLNGQRLLREILPTATEKDVRHADSDGELDIEFPETAADIELSLSGALFLYTEEIVTVNSTANKPKEWQISDELSMARFSQLLSDVGLTQDLGNLDQTHSPALLDAITFLGLLQFDRHWSRGTDVESTKGAQDVVLKLTSSLPFVSSALLRSHIHSLAQSIFHQNLSAQHRVDLVMHVIERSPFDNLTASVLKWIKDEIAAPPCPASSQSSTYVATILTQLSPVIFKLPSPAEPGKISAANNSNHTFVLAVLALLRLILTNKAAATQLDSLELNGTSTYTAIGKYLEDVTIYVKCCERLESREPEDAIELVRLNQEIVLDLLNTKRK